jgi:uncharacterized protein YqeY
MKLTERINADFMEAFKAKDMNKKNFLGVVKGEIQNEVGRSGKDDDETVMGILKNIINYQMMPLRWLHNH